MQVTVVAIFSGFVFAGSSFSGCAATDVSVCTIA